MNVFRAVKIIAGPAWIPLVQIAAAFGLPVSVFLLMIGVGGEPVHDANRLRRAVAAAKLAHLTKALERFRANHDRYPSAAGGLQALDPAVTHDPWSMPYQYRPAADAAPEILSYGADRKPGGEGFNADISSREPWRPIPPSPAEIRWRRFVAALGIAGFIGLLGSVSALVLTSGRCRFIDRVRNTRYSAPPP